MRSLKAVCGALIAAGALLRFVDLPRKVFWIDESTTVERVAGVPDAEILSAFKSRAGVPPSFFAPYRSPNGAWIDTVRRGIAEDPRMPPLYFLALRAWMSALGSSILAARSFSAVLGALAILAMFRFAALLFPGMLAPWLAAALLAASPFHLRFAQEARPYALWTLLLLLLFERFLALMKEPTAKNRFLYILAAAMCAYTHPMTAAAAAAQLGSAVLGKGVEPGARRSVILCAAALLVLCAPWIAVNLTHRGAAYTWYALGTNPLSFIMSLWCVNIGRLFLEFPPERAVSSLTIVLSTLPFLILIAASFDGLLRRGSPVAIRFLAATVVLTFAAVAAPDLLLGGQRSTISRFLMPMHLAIEAAVAYYLSELVSGRGTRRLAGLLCAGLVLAAGGWSSWRYVGSDFVWGQGSTAPRAIASAVNASAKPLLFVDLKENSTADLVTLSYYLADHVMIKPLAPGESRIAAAGRAPVYFYVKTGSLARRLAARGVRLDFVPVKIEGPPDAALYRVAVGRKSPQLR